MEIEVQIKVTDSTALTTGERDALDDALRAVIKPVLDRFVADRASASQGDCGTQESQAVGEQTVSVEVLRKAVLTAYARGALGAVTGILGGKVASPEEMEQAVDGIVADALK